MKYIKKFENINEVFDIEKIVPREKIYNVFYTHSLSCDPKHNKFLNYVEYMDEEYKIRCNFTALTYNGKTMSNILETLQKICYEIGSDDFTFGNYNNYGSYLVTFEYSKEKLKELEVIADSNKYNI